MLVLATNSKKENGMIDHRRMGWATGGVLNCSFEGFVTAALFMLSTLESADSMWHLPLGVMEVKISHTPISEQKIA